MKPPGQMLPMQGNGALAPELPEASYRIRTSAAIKGAPNVGGSAAATTSRHHTDSCRNLRSGTARESDYQ